MRFDGSRAWAEAMALIRANREVLLVMAGVFLFLPAVGMAFFLGPRQAEMMTSLLAAMKGGANLQDPAFHAQMQALNAANLQMLPAVALAVLAQTIGHLGMMALLTDHRRPTVGEALLIALRVLPSLIGTLLVLFCFYVAAVMVAGIGAALLAIPFGAAGLAKPFVAVLIALVAVALAAAVTRLSMLLPVMVIDGVRHPLRVIKGSWALVKGNTWRLFAFFVALLIAYLVVAVVAIMALGSLLALAGHGTPSLLGMGLVSGALSATVGMVATALLVAIHRQLAQARG